MKSTFQEFLNKFTAFLLPMPETELKFSKRGIIMSEITNILNLCKLSESDAKYCEECFAKIKANLELFEILTTAEKHYMMGYDPKEDLKALSDKSGIHRYTVDMLLLIYSSVRLLKIYDAHGYSEELYSETVGQSIRLNIDTCKEIYKVVGIFVFFGFIRLFQCERFALGRLQFEAVAIPYDYKDICKKGDIVLSCHIPASGPLLTDDVESAFKKAYEFFKIKGKMVVVCSSWMLYPKHYEKVFPKNSNLSRFYELFDIIDQKEKPFTADAWRVFGTMNPDLEKLPQKTTLQKNLYNYLKDGNSMGSGYGILVRNYD